MGVLPVQVLLNFAKDVSQGWGRRHFHRNRKRQAVGLSFAVVGVLAQDDDADSGKGGGFQSAKNLVLCRIDGPRGSQLRHLSKQLKVITLLE